MKKTVSIHLGRQLFIIEEDAYNRLQQYLFSLEQKLASEEGSAEILEDIEMRFAELLLTQIGAAQNVVTLLQVNAAIASLGEAEEISGDEPQQHFYQESTHQGKQFFRDTQNGIVAGVSAGLAAYFKIDPLFIRVAFFLLTFTGVGVPLYFLLWVLLPDAKTPADRIRMQGKSVNIDTIKEEFYKAAKTIRKDSERVGQRFREGTSTAVENTKELVRRLLQLAGIVIVFLGFAALIGLSLTLTGLIDFIPTTGEEEFISFRELLRLSMGPGSNFELMYWGIIIMGYGGIILLILLGFRLITKQYNQQLRFIRFGFGLVFVTGLICTVLSAVRLGREFSVNTEVNHLDLTYAGDMLELEDLPLYQGKHRVVKVNGLNFLEVHNGKMVAGGVLVTLRPTSDSVYHIRQIFSANSGNRAKAARLASDINHVIVLENNKLKIHPSYTFPVADAIRNQEVEIQVDVPINKKLLINNNTAITVSGEMRATLYAGEPIEFW